MSFFRFGGVPDWLGWRSFEEWSGHWLVLSWLARRALTTLAAFAYLRWLGSRLVLLAMLITTPCRCADWRGSVAGLC